MDKRTILAVALSLVVFVGGMIISETFFRPEVPPQAAQPVEEAIQTPAAPAVAPPAAAPEDIAVAVPEEEEIPLQIIRGETDLYYITFSSKGGVLTSLRLKDHLDAGEPLEMISRGSEDQAAFNILLGDAQAAPLDVNFHTRTQDQNTWEFYRTLLAPDGVPYTLRKIYTFVPGEYMMELRVVIENSRNSAPALNYNNYAYTLEFGPQIGPTFDPGDRYEYRNYYNFSERKAQKLKATSDKNPSTAVSGRSRWTAIAGKYFTAIGIPDATNYHIEFNQYPRAGLERSSNMTFSRPVITNVNRTEDVFRFYLGPKTKKALSLYDKAENNALGLAAMDLESVVDSNPLIGWLEWILQQLLMISYRLVKNYGVAIIIVTIILKLILHPITRKSTQSAAKMQDLQPQMDEMRKKYANNPEKLNAEMANLYKKEGVNPMSGCLPLLLQMPIIFAMYALVNKHFELRGAVFIPGWINDLSQPEAIYTFKNFTIPLLNWNAIRGLPILFVLSQLFYGRLTQTGGTGSGANAQMKMMTNIMPIMFFFILYNVPSGLLVYWITQNVVTIIQQVFTRWRQHKKAQLAAVEGPEKILVPDKGKDGKKGSGSKVLPGPKGGSGSKGQAGSKGPAGSKGSAGKPAKKKK